MKSIALSLSIVIASIASTYGGNFEIDRSASVIGADAKASPPHTFTTIATDYTYDIQINPETLDVSKATFSFKFSDLDSNSAKRDKKMLDWMNIVVNPKASFELTETVLREGQTIGKGTFSMHGTSREIEIPFVVSKNGDKVILDGETEFDYTDWDLEIVRLLFFTVKPSLKPHFHLEGTIEKN
jgi:polyisoprenoid-binding protein YceI